MSNAQFVDACGEYPQKVYELAKLSLSELVGFRRSLLPTTRALCVRALMGFSAESLPPIEEEYRNEIVKILV